MIAQLKEKKTADLENLKSEIQTQQKENAECKRKIEQLTNAKTPSSNSKLISENEKLLNENKELSAKVDALNEKIEEIQTDSSIFVNSQNI